MLCMSTLLRFGSYCCEFVYWIVEAHGARQAQTAKPDAVDLVLVSQARTLTVICSRDV